MDERRRKFRFGRFKISAKSVQHQTVQIFKMRGADQAYRFSNFQRQNATMIESSKPGTEQIEQIRIGSADNQPHIEGFAPCGPQSFHGNQPVDNMQIRFQLPIEVDDILGQILMGFFLVFLTHQTSHQIFQTHTHPHLKMGLDFGEIDHKIAVETGCGHPGLNSLFELDETRRILIQITNIHPEMAGQAVNLQPGNHADPVTIIPAVGSFADGDMTVPRLFQKRDDRCNQPQIGGIAG